MSYYMQLLGTDVPNSYGGCCYYGPIDHPAFQSTPEGTTAAPTSEPMNASSSFPHVFATYCDAPHTHSTSTSSSGASGSEGYLLFNCPEGVQRFSSEANIKLTRVKGFLFTRFASSDASRTKRVNTTTATRRRTTTTPLKENSDTEEAAALAEAAPLAPRTPAEWFERTRQMGAASAVMGLPGLLFTINDAGIRGAHLFGPSTCQHALHAVPAPLASTPSLYARPSHDAQLCTAASSGVERFVMALRKHYFTYRPMSFRLLCPTHVPVTSATADAVQKDAETLTTRLGAVAEGQPRQESAMADATLTEQYTPTLPALYTEDEIFPIATPTPAVPRVARTTHALPEPPFIVAVMQLSAHALLIAFRVSGGHVRWAEKTPASAQQHAPDVSRSAPRRFHWCDTHDLVLGYAIVHAPPPAFDAQRARALGVKPGKKFGLLKDGEPVMADVDEQTLERPLAKKSERNTHTTQPQPPGAPPAKRARGDASVRTMLCVDTDAATSTPASTAEPAHEPVATATARWVRPEDVMRDTIASRHIYLSLVLDGDEPDDVQRAVTQLIDHELEGVLTHTWPHLLHRCQSTHAKDGGDGNSKGGGSGANVRTLVLRHAIHLQPRSYFSGFAAVIREGGTTDKGCAPHAEVQEPHVENAHARAESDQRIARTEPCEAEDVFTSYSHFLFDSFTSSHSRHCCASLRGSLRLSISPSLFTSSRTAVVAPSFSTPPTTKASGIVDEVAPVTHHVFSAEVIERYTAYPTALAHRYHLHLLAPSLFPMHPGAPSFRQEHGHARHLGQDTERCQTDGVPVTAQMETSASETRATRATSPLPDAHTEDWPYSYKLRCIPEDKLHWWARPDAKKEGTRDHGKTETQAAKKGRAHAAAEDFTNNGAGLIRYPTAQSAVALLTDVFYRREAEALKQLQETSFSSPSSRSPSDALVTEDGALVFLGTGSAVPSKHRNVSGTYLELHLPCYCFGHADPLGSSPSGRTAGVTVPPTALQRGIVVLDFGEGSCGQLASLLEYRRQRLGLGLSFDGPTTSAARDEANDEDGDDALAQFVRDVVLIFISHAHADHHLGLTTLLSLRHFYLSRDGSRRGRSGVTLTPEGPEGTPAPKLLIVCPREVYEYVIDTWGFTAPYASWLAEEVVFDCMPCAYSARAQPMAGELDATTAAIPEESAVPEEVTRVERTSSSTLSVPDCLPQLAAWMKRLNTTIASVEKDTQSKWWDADVFTVDHPANAHALLLRFPSVHVTAASSPSSPPSSCSPCHARSLRSKVFLFSGDTRPCRSLVARSARFCDVARDERVAICLHEATFGPGYEAEALRKKHSTLPEALRVGREWLKAETVVLNHFSQRYPKLPGLTEAHLGGVAVDLQCRRRGATAHTTETAVNAREEEHADTAADGAGVSPSSSPSPSTSSDAALRAGHDMCFAFDLMRLPFISMQQGLPASLTPSFVRLLEEYESWSTGTTQRLRE